MSRTAATANQSTSFHVKFRGKLVISAVALTVGTAKLLQKRHGRTMTFRPICPGNRSEHGLPDTQVVRFRSTATHLLSTLRHGSGSSVSDVEPSTGSRHVEGRGPSRSTPPTTHRRRAAGSCRQYSTPLSEQPGAGRAVLAGACQRGRLSGDHRVDPEPVRWNRSRATECSGDRLRPQWHGGGDGTDAAPGGGAASGDRDPIHHLPTRRRPDQPVSHQRHAGSDRRAPR